MLEVNKIICGDCLEVLKTLPDNCIDLTVTSPPYNMRLRVRNGKYTQREKGESFSKKYQHFTDDLPIELFYETHKQILNELLRVSKIVFYNFQIVTGSKEAYFKIIGEFAPHIKDIIVWNKGEGQPAMHPNVLNASHEFILILEGDNKNGRAITNSYFDRGTLSNLWNIINKAQDTDSHNASFPVKLAAKIIHHFSKEGDLVLDPFMGTGTTAIAAIKEKRNWVGIEISEEYCALARKRIQPYLDQTQLF